MVLAVNTKNFSNKRFKKEESIISREIAGEFILVPIRSRTSDIDGFYTLNEVGARIWQLVDGKATVQEIMDSILQEYEVGSAEAEKDIEELLLQLEHIRVLKEV
jgi:hypothetical protein